MPSTSSPVADAEESREQHLRRLETLAGWLDSAFRIPGTQIRFGFDSILGLFPGVGDTVMALPSLYVLTTAHHLGAPWHVLARMVGNIAIDTVVGTVPLLGDILDVSFKANQRNVAVLRDHFDRA